jgi:hypothetical protein
MPRKPPISMNSELSRWNGGKGIDLESWISGSGNFSLAIGYSEIFWPRFVEFEGYIFQENFSESALRQFETSNPNDKKIVEWIMNHIHLDSIHYIGCNDLTKDKIIFLGHILKEIYEAKLAWQFPDKPCTVKFYIPEDEDDLTQYQIAFWQKKHESAEGE